MVLVGTNLGEGIESLESKERKCAKLEGHHYDKKVNFTAVSRSRKKDERVAGI